MNWIILTYKELVEESFLMENFDKLIKFVKFINSLHCQIFVPYGILQ